MSFHSLQDLTQTEFFVYVLPFLLVFALSYAFLGNIFEKNKNTRVIISAILGALILPFAPVLSTFLSKLAGGFLIVIGAILVLIILVEVSGVKGKKPVKVTQDGKTVETHEPISILEQYGKVFGVLLVSIAILIFVQSGGLQLLGIQSSGAGGLFSFISAPVVFFVILIALMVWWVSSKN